MVEGLGGVAGVCMKRNGVRPYSRISLMMSRLIRVFSPRVGLWRWVLLPSGAGGDQLGGALAIPSRHKAVNNLLDDIFHVLIFCLKSHTEYFTDLKISFAKSSDSLMSYSNAPTPHKKKKIPQTPAYQNKVNCL